MKLIILILFFLVSPCFAFAASSNWDSMIWDEDVWYIDATTAINLSYFTATPKSGKVILQWTTEAEIDNAGFNLFRSLSEDGDYVKINTELIPAKGSSTQGVTYEFTDTNMKNRKTYYYKLEDIDLNGKSTMHGPLSATPRTIWGLWR